MADANFSLAVFKLANDVKFVQFGDSAYSQKVGALNASGYKPIGTVGVTLHTEGVQLAFVSDDPLKPCDELRGVMDTLGARLVEGDLMLEGETVN